MARRPSRGRQRIPIRRIENQDDLYATFSKRRRGLYKKASELSTLCGVDVGIIIISPTNNPFTFWSPCMQSVTERYTNPNQPLGDHARDIDALARNWILHSNSQLDGVLDEKDQMKTKEKQLIEIDNTREKVWWEEISVESMNNEHVAMCEYCFEDFSFKVKDLFTNLKNGASSSSMPFQPQNAPYFSSGPAAIGPSNFVQNFHPGSSAVPTVELSLPSRFSGQFNNVRPQTQLSFVGDGTSHVPVQYYPPPEAQFLLDGGGSRFVPFSGLLNYIHPKGKDQTTSGIGVEESSGGTIGQHGVIEGQSSRGGVGESSARGGTEETDEEEDPSHQRNTNP